MMTIEEKAKSNDGNYKTYTKLINRLENVKDAIKKQNYGIAMDILYKPYPEFQITTSTELKESEDERIRKVIADIVKAQPSDSLFNGTKEKCLAWLEKQGEQEPVDKIQIGKKYKCTASPRYSTFVRGLIYRPEDEFLCSLMNLCSDCFEPIEDDEQNPAEYNKEISTNLKDIVDKEANTIWEEESSDGCHLVIDSFNMFYGICMQIAEAVVDYRKPAWSEEDEENFKWFDKFFRAESVISEGKDIPQDRYLWFKNLKDKVQPQSKQEWSEEEQQIIEDAACIILDCVNTAETEKEEKRLEELADKLQDLKPQSQWKPSDEQIEALESATENCAYSEYQGCLRELIEQLKKLKG